MAVSAIRCQHVYDVPQNTGDTPLSASQVDIYVEITNANDRPAITSTAFSWEENDPSLTKQLVWTDDDDTSAASTWGCCHPSDAFSLAEPPTGGCGGRFRIDATTGVLSQTNSPALDHEDLASCQVLITVKDKAGLTNLRLTRLSRR